MEQIFEFLLNHWVLVLTFVAILLWIIRFETSTVISGVQILTPQETVSLINHQQATVIDIRNKKLYEQGHILGSLLTDLSQFDNQLKEFEKYQKKPLIITCHSGQQALKVGAKLKKAGYEKIYCLKGGIQNWISAGLPLNKE